MLDDRVGVVVEGVVRTKEGDWQPWRRHSTNKELAGANSLKGGQGCRKRPLQVMRQDADEEEMVSCLSSKIAGIPTSNEQRTLSAEEKKLTVRQAGLSTTSQ